MNLKARGFTEFTREPYRYMIYRYKLKFFTGFNLAPLNNEPTKKNIKYFQVTLIQKTFNTIAIYINYNLIKSPENAHNLIKRCAFLPSSVLSHFCFNNGQLSYILIQRWAHYYVHTILSRLMKFQRRNPFQEILETYGEIGEKRWKITLKL